MATTGPFDPAIRALMATRPRSAARGPQRNIEAEPCDPASREEGRGCSGLENRRMLDRHGDRHPTAKAGGLDWGQHREVRFPVPLSPTRRWPGCHHRVEHLPQANFQEPIEIVHL